MRVELRKFSTRACERGRGRRRNRSVWVRAASGTPAKSATHHPPSILHHPPAHLSSCTRLVRLPPPPPAPHSAPSLHPPPPSLHPLHSRCSASQASSGIRLTSLLVARSACVHSRFVRTCRNVLTQVRARCGLDGRDAGEMWARYTPAAHLHTCVPYLYLYTALTSAAHGENAPRK